MLRHIIVNANVVEGFNPWRLLYRAWRECDAVASYPEKKRLIKNNSIPQSKIDMFIGEVIVVGTKVIEQGEARKKISKQEFSEATVSITKPTQSQNC